MQTSVHFFILQSTDISMLFKCLKFSLNIELNLKLKKLTFSDLKFSSIKKSSSF